MRTAIACGLILLACIPAAAGGVVAVLSSESPYYRLAFEGFQDAWGSPVTHLLLGEGAVTPQARVVVTFGSEASLHQWPEESLLVACVAPAAPDEREGGVIKVSMLPEPSHLLQRIKTVLPGVRRLKVLWTSPAQEDSVAELEDAASAVGFALSSERLSSAQALPGALRSLRGKADALLLMPDPVLVNASSFAVLREYSKAAAIPFLAPSEGLAEKGATATFAVPIRELGRTAAIALRSHLDGRGSPQRTHADVLTVTVNASAAAEVGLDVSALRGVDRVVP